jgi:BTB/POZ domain
MGDEVVTIHAGPDKKKCLIHKQLLINNSDYFSKALTSSFKESQEVVYFEEETTHAFDLLVALLYHNKIPSILAPIGKIVSNAQSTSEYSPEADLSVETEIRATGI